jgi:hypothetical protein
MKMRTQYWCMILRHQSMCYDMTGFAVTLILCDIFFHPKMTFAHIFAHFVMYEGAHQIYIDKRAPGM